MFAYLVFSFGFVGHIGSNAIVPSLLILPLFMSIARATFYHLGGKSRSCGWSMLFGLSSMYILNEDNISVDENDQQKIEGKKRSMHITYDIYSVIETGMLTILGVHYLEDANFDKMYFMILMTHMEVFGKLFKATYYLYLHPWSNLNPVYKKYKIAHTCLSFAFFVAFLAFTAWYSNSHVVNILVLCLYGVILPMIILFQVREICKSSLHEKQTSLAKVRKVEEGLTNQKMKIYKESKSFDIFIDPTYHHKLIGRKGAVITKLRNDYKVKIQLPKKDKLESSIITLTGNEENAMEARDAILKIVGDSENFIKIDVLIDTRVHSMIIGHCGSGIRKIMQDFDVILKMPFDKDPQPNLIIIIGKNEDYAHKCKNHLVNLAEKYDQKVLDNEICENSTSKSGSSLSEVSGASFFYKALGRKL